MFWNSIDEYVGFRIVTNKVVHITSFNKDFGDHLFLKRRGEFLFFNTFASPNWYIVHKWYKETNN